MPVVADTKRGVERTVNVIPDDGKIGELIIEKSDDDDNFPIRLDGQGVSNILCN